jgi:endonuclease/exonuclease/phosphatase family metal-dependent hydrolase
MIVMKDIIKIANFNCQSGVCTTRGYLDYILTGWKYVFPHTSENIARAGETFAKEDIDILFLTEVDGGSYRTENTDQVRLLSEKMRLKGVFFPTYTGIGQMNQGNAIITGYEVLGTQSYRLPGRGEPRYIEEVVMSMNGKEIASLVTHLSLSKKTRKKQINYILERIKNKKTPWVLCGDFNTDDETELSGLNLCGVAACDFPTYPSWNPKRSFDKVYVSRDFTVEKKYVLDDLIVSDHLPVIVEVVLR